MKETFICALGFFDGVHLGHGALLSACRRLADSQHCRAAAVTFANHPDGLVQGKVPALISSLPDRERMMKERFAMDRVVTLPFDEALRTMDWEAFLKMLMQDYGAIGFVCGDDFRFGYRGEGDADRLARFCDERELPCWILREQKVDGERISSSRIRQFIEEGSMGSAVKMLGHPYILTGTVVHGQQLGRRLGFPTANVLLPEGVAAPKYGVYVCACVINGRRYAAVTNVGTRPTVGGKGITVEPWILDFAGDLYGKEITLEFYYFLRPEKKFPDLAALQQEIWANARETRSYLTEGGFL